MCLVVVQVVGWVGKGSLLFPNVSVVQGVFTAREHSALKVLYGKYSVAWFLVLGSNYDKFLVVWNTKVGSCIHPQFFEANTP